MASSPIPWGSCPRWRLPNHARVTPRRQPCSPTSRPSRGSPAISLGATNAVRGKRRAPGRRSSRHSPTCRSLLGWPHPPHAPVRGGVQKFPITGRCVAPHTPLPGVSVPSPPSQVSSPAPPSRVSSPWSPQSWSLPAPPRSVSCPAPPQSTSLPPRPRSRSSPPRPWITSSPAVPTRTSACGRAHQRGPVPVAEHHRQELHRTNVAAPFLGPQDAALILAQWLALGVAAVAGAAVAGRAAGYQGMGQGRAAVVGQRGVEDVREQDASRGDQVRGARE